MNNQPILSIIIPLYNCEKYIRQCLYSIFRQEINESEYEVIVIDDGSKDNGCSLAYEYAKSNKRIREWLVRETMPWRKQREIISRL